MPKKPSEKRKHKRKINTMLSKDKVGNIIRNKMLLELHTQVENADGPQYMKVPMAAEGKFLYVVNEAFIKEATSEGKGS